MGPLLRALAGVSRAPFLLLPVGLIAAGATASAVDGHASWPRGLLALLGLVAAHIAVNVLNEASDFETGIDLETTRTPFSGGSGTLPSGALDARAARTWAAVAFTIAAAVGVAFVVDVGWPLVPVLALGAVAVLAYTPFLTRTVLGEVFAGLGLGALPVLGASIVQDAQAGPATWAAAVPALLMTFNLLLLNEFPDEAADRRGGRKNLVLRLGRERAAWVYAGAVLAVPAWITGTVAAGVLPPLALLAILPTAACVPGLRWAFGDARLPVPLPALGGNVIWNLATLLLLALGMSV